MAGLSNQKVDFKGGDPKSILTKLTFELFQKIPKADVKHLAVKLFSEDIFTEPEKENCEDQDTLLSSMRNKSPDQIEFFLNYLCFYHGLPHVRDIIITTIDTQHLKRQPQLLEPQSSSSNTNTVALQLPQPDNVTFDPNTVSMGPQNSSVPKIKPDTVNVTGLAKLLITNGKLCASWHVVLPEILGTKPDTLAGVTLARKNGTAGVYENVLTLVEDWRSRTKSDEAVIGYFIKKFESEDLIELADMLECEFLKETKVISN